jgi:hypothetical protein
VTYTKWQELCEIAKKNGHVVEIQRNPQGECAVWVVPHKPKKFSIGSTTAGMRIAIVGSPFMDPERVPVESHAHQLVQMLKERGYE